MLVAEGGDQFEGRADVGGQAGWEETQASALSRGAYALAAEDRAVDDATVDQEKQDGDPTREGGLAQYADDASSFSRCMPTYRSASSTRASRCSSLRWRR